MYLNHGMAMWMAGDDGDDGVQGGTVFYYIPIFFFKCEPVKSQPHKYWKWFALLWCFFRLWFPLPLGKIL